VELMLIPTAGYESGTREPSERGIHRMRRATEFIGKSTNFRIGIVGGEGMAYLDYFNSHFPKYWEMVAFVSHSTKITNRDFPEATESIDAFFQTPNCSSRERQRAEYSNLHIISHPNHLWIIRRVLKKLGYRDITHYHSGETAPYPYLTQQILCLVTRIDPFYKWLGLPLVWLASRRP